MEVIVNLIKGLYEIIISDLTLYVSVIALAVVGVRCLRGFIPWGVFFSTLFGLSILIAPARFYEWIRSTGGSTTSIERFDDSPVVFSLPAGLTTKSSV